MLASIEILLIPKVEQVMKSVNASSGHGVGSVVLDSDQRDFSENIEGLQMIDLNRMNSHTDLNRVDVTLGYFTVEGVELLINERNLDWTYSLITW